jgi:hypothetical protein
VSGSAVPRALPPISFPGPIYPPIPAPIVPFQQSVSVPEVRL